MADEERLEDIQTRLTQLEDRLRRIEQWFPAGAPPVQRFPPTPSQAVVRTETATTGAAPAKTAKPTQRADTEYKIGAQVLPRVGAAVLLVGVAYLVKLAIDRNLISPLTQWIGEMLLCTVFIAAGLIKRNEKEEFGQVLIGIGSCGLYLSFAGAMVFKHLISAGTLVELFLSLSYANLAFSYWRSSPSFLGIGILGGIAGALMPLQEHNVAVSGALQLSILVAASIVIARNRWLLFAVALLGICFLTNSASMYPVHGDEWTQIGFLYADALVCLTATGLCYQPMAWDPQEVLLPFAVFSYALLAISARPGWKGSLHSAAFAVLVALLAAAFPHAYKVKGRLLAGSACVVFLLCPSGFEEACTNLYCGLAIVLSVLFYRRSLLKTPFLPVATMLFGIGSYAALSRWEEPWPAELASVLFLTAAILTVGTGVYSRSDRDSELCLPIELLTGLGAAGFFLRAAYVLGPRLNSHWPPELNQIYGGLIAAMIGGVLDYRRRMMGVRICAWALYAYAALNYVDLAVNRSITPNEELLALASLTGAVMLLTRLTSRTGTAAESTVAIAAIVNWLTISRAAYLLLTLPPIGMREAAAVSVAWTAYAVLLMAAGFLRKLSILRHLALGLFGLTLGKVFLYDLASLDAGVRVAVLIGLGLAMIGGGYWYVRARQPSDPAKV
ncbi:MAG TPA: DUF2339 domain-containing protein [Fimbriimonas sp.]|nr:DUF2339 domain-containing protein [Fimbriimonas sp.]